MKITKVSGLIISAMCSLWASPSFSEDQGRHIESLIFETSDLPKSIPVTIPWGRSYLDITFTQSGVYNPIVLSYTPQASCPTIPLTELKVLYQGDLDWMSSDFRGNGRYFIEERPISKLRVIFEQKDYQQETCLLQMAGKKISYQKTLTAVFEYDGGFIYRQAIALEQEETLRKVLIEVPHWCSPIDNLELTAQVNDEIVEAQARGEGVFEFQEELVLDQLLVSMNAPRSLSCDIPIYVFARKAES